MCSDYIKVARKNIHKMRKYYDTIILAECVKKTMNY